MAYDIGRLRQQNLMGGYDQLTPGGGGGNYMDEGSNPTSPYTPGLEQVAAQQDNDVILGPDGQPLQQDSPIQAPTVAPVAAPQVNPNARTFKQTLDEMNAGYTPDYTARDRNNRLLDAPPERQSPGWGRTLVAAGMSVKAADPIGTAEKIQYAPYYRDVEDWKTKADPYFKAAELENRQNINERTIVSNAAAAYSAAERNRIAEENNTNRNNAALIRANADAAKAAKWTVKVVGPDVMAYSPDGQSSKRLGSSGNLTQEEKINLEGGFKVEAAKAYAAGAAERTADAGNEYYDTPEGPVVGNPRTGTPLPKGATRMPSAPTGGQPSARERKAQEQEAMEDAYTTHSSEASKYMKGDGKGGLTWKTRPTPGEGKTFGIFGGNTEADAEAYDKYRSSIDPHYKPPTSNSKPSPIGGSNRVPGPPDSTDQTAGMDPDASSTPNKGIAGGVGPNYQLRKNPRNPKEMARTLDGKTWQKSTDGGRTWR